MLMDIKFEELDESAYPLVEKWLRQPHVKRWWDDGDVTPEKVRTDYGPEPGIARYVLSIRPYRTTALRAAGFFQHYEMPDGAIGIDLFIGEPDLVNKGLGTEAVKSFSAMIFRRFRPASIFVDPHPENKAAVRCYEKAGFTIEGEGVSAEGEPALLMRLFPEDGR